MTRLIRRFLVLAGAIATGALVLPAAPASAASERAAPAPVPAVTASAAAAAVVLDGVQLRYLPPGLSGSSDFTYEYDDVAFASRVWESQTTDGGWRVDLNVDVMRGARLSDAQSLHDWFIEYEQRPPAEAHYHRISVHGQAGWRCHDQVFWLVRPGLAISVQLDRTRWSRVQLTHIVRSARVLNE